MKAKFVMTGLLAVFAGVASAEEVTAYQLIKTGDQYIGIQSKDRVVGIHSDKSVGSVTPDIWYVDYYDPDAAFKAVEVKFGAGQKMDVSRPGRVLEWFSDEKEPLDPLKLKVDSSQAIQIATSQPLLKNLTIRSTQLWLEHGDVGPQWKVKLWAAKVEDTSESADIGVVILSAADGTVIKMDLHPSSAD